MVDVVDLTSSYRELRNLTVARHALAEDSTGVSVALPAARTQRRAIQTRDRAISVHAYSVDPTADSTEGLDKSGFLIAQKRQPQSDVGEYFVIAPPVSREVMNGTSHFGKLCRAHVDGTFCVPNDGAMRNKRRRSDDNDASSSPKWQVVVIYAHKTSSDGVAVGPTVPLLCAIMSSRHRAAYDSVFRDVRDWVPGFRPAFFTCDFESALRASFGAIFNCGFWGCAFHFLAAVKRKCGKLALGRQMTGAVVQWARELAFAPTEGEFDLRLVGFMMTIDEDDTPIDDGTIATLRSRLSSSAPRASLTSPLSPPFRIPLFDRIPLSGSLPSLLRSLPFPLVPSRSLPFPLVPSRPLSFPPVPSRSLPFPPLPPLRSLLFPPVPSRSHVSRKLELWRSVYVWDSGAVRFSGRTRRQPESYPSCLFLLATSGERGQGLPRNIQSWSGPCASACMWRRRPRAPTIARRV